MFYKGKLLKLSERVNGYLQIGLSKGNTQTFYFVHSLVMRAFKGKCPGGKEVAHDNGIKTNNHLTNLRYTTPTENCQDKIKHGTSSRGGKSNSAKLTEREVKDIRKRVKDCSQTELAKEYKVGQSTISSIIRQKTWAHI